MIVRGNSMKILIVDDEQDIANILSEEIVNLGHEVIDVRDIPSAEKVWNGCSYALIDTMNGSFEFALKLKAKGVKTISFTGYNKIKTGNEDAFVGSLHKPWDDDELLKLFKSSN
jgi:DNA-binding NtrC family response regulator